uniref:Uncharacterized protein n=1 Tax=uncultured bacterium contig00066 TaxID=1181548 RepID=A0A806JY68_9BACT|nr:hypothetical protein [uncultured bacterium contig00066]
MLPSFKPALCAGGTDFQYSSAKEMPKLKTTDRHIMEMTVINDE